MPCTATSSVTAAAPGPSGHDGPTLVTVQALANGPTRAEPACKAGRVSMGPIEETRPRLAPAFGEAVATYDLPTAEHSSRVGALSRAVGAMLELDEADLEALAYAGRLHDLGKLGVPERTLACPGPLGAAQWQEIKRHPTIGADLVRSCYRQSGGSYSDQLDVVVAGIETHHERFDGSGYPAGYAREEIPLIGRIVGLVDVYDSMTQERSYRRQVFTSEEALGYLAEKSGTLFDPTLVPVMIEVARSR